MITKSKIIERINFCEEKFNKCWNTLSNLKENKAIEELASFQIDLAECIYTLTEVHHLIKKEQNDITGRINNLNLSWCKKRLKTLSHYNYTINTTISIGKSIGDAFVWYWYRLESDQLVEHGLHENDFYFPTGIGGLGELEIVRNLPLIEKQFVLYHGITNILRIGDVSLFDIEKMQLSGLGEIKSKIDETNKGRITVSITMLTPKSREFFDIEKFNVVIDEDITSDYIDPERFKRQLSKMGDTVKKLDLEINNDDIHVVEKKTYFDELQVLISNSRINQMTTKKVDQGLIIMTLNINRKNLANRILKKAPKFKNTNENVILSIFDYESDENGKILSTIHIEYKKGGTEVNLTMGTKPLFWQDIDINKLKKIYFLNTIVFTIYNPLFFIKSLRENGLIIEKVKNKIEIYKQTTKGKMKVGKFNYFIDLVNKNLYTEKSVTEALKKIHVTCRGKNK
jgi:hypothetical protein